MDLAHAVSWGDDARSSAMDVAVATSSIVRRSGRLVVWGIVANSLRHGRGSVGGGSGVPSSDRHAGSVARIDDVPAAV
jgi:hypothetical protein